MILADTSVWVDVLNRFPSPEAALLRALLNAADVLMPDLVLTETLQGLRSDAAEAEALRVTSRLPQVTVGGMEVALASARYYRDLRRRGITIRSTIDCLLATYCILNGIELLHRDKDFDPFEEHFGLRVVKA